VTASEKATVKDCASGTQSTAVYGVRMIVLLAIAFVAGAITAVSPCVLPVLPIVFGSSAAGEGRRRSLAIIAGTVVEGPRPRDALLELRFWPGVEAYSFTFG
jgi:thiol:disulfide interchange protein